MKRPMPTVERMKSVLERHLRPNGFLFLSSPMVLKGQDTSNACTVKSEKYLVFSSERKCRVPMHAVSDLTS